MSLAAVRWAKAQRCGSSGMKLDLLVLAEAANDEPRTSMFGRSWPALHTWVSVAYLEEITEQDRKTVLRNLKALEAAGFIVRAGTDGRTNQIAVFRLPVTDSESGTSSGLHTGSESATGAKNGTGPDFQSTSAVFAGDQCQISLPSVPKTGQGTTKGTTNGTTKGTTKSASTRKATLTTIPDNFSISERVQSWAAKNGFDQLPAHLEAFVGKARAKAYRYASWDEALMGAIRADWAGLRQEKRGFAQRASVVNIEARNAEARRLLGFGNPEEVVDA